MRFSRRDICKSLALAPLVAVLPTGANAQAYPDKPVRFILPFGAGGVADVTSRLVAEKLGEKLGQRFVVENMPGAGGIAAARAALAGGNDGYTVALITNGNAISAALFKSLPFDPVKDFAPISSIGKFDCLFIVNAGSPYKTLGGLGEGRARAAGQAQRRHHHRGLDASTSPPSCSSRPPASTSSSCRPRPRAKRWCRCCATTSTW